jgi:hypothetical protein
VLPIGGWRVPEDARTIRGRHVDVHDAEGGANALERAANQPEMESTDQPGERTSELRERTSPEDGSRTPCLRVEFVPARGVAELVEQVEGPL